MKYEIPVRSIKVAGHNIPIRTGKQITERLKEGSFYGRCYNTDKSILVDGTLKPSEFSNSFIHEVIETVDTIFCDSKLNHGHVVRIANGLHQVMEGLGIRFVPPKRRGMDATQKG